MHRAWLALALLACGTARGQAPAYSAAGIVNAVDYTPGPFAPNSVLSLFGTNLAFDPGLFTAPPWDSVAVYVDNKKAPLLMVSANQINFLVPADEIPGTANVVVVRQGVAGPSVAIPLVAAAPCLFPSPGGYALAEDWNNGYAVMTPETPAHAGDTIVLFATGLGAVQVALDSNPVVGIADPIADPSSLKVLLNGSPLDPLMVKYVGLTPGWAGLYQINLQLPAGVGTDPTVQIVMGGRSSLAGLKLAVR